MVNVKKKRNYFTYFVILLTFSAIIACKTKTATLYEIQGKQINISKDYSPDQTIENFIDPYKNHINKDLDNILANNPVTQDKSIGKWETNIGNLLAEATLELSRPVFEKKENKTIDLCILNHGGIRSIIPQGNVTTRTAFEVMPFENSLIVATLKGSAIQELAEYFLNERKPHPLAGIKIYLEKDEKTIKKIEINNQPLDVLKTYYVVTSDYLVNGGDNMNFFKTSAKNFDLEYKIRNLLIDYFKKVDTLPNNNNPKIILEN